jgi:hypothetical protein
VTGALHSSETNEHPTPGAVIDLVHALFGGAPDLDPASLVSWNAGVGAQSIMTLPDERALCAGAVGGLGEAWHGRVFLNPPGGGLAARSGDSRGVKVYKRSVRAAWDTRSHAVAWWRKLLHEYSEGRVREAVFVGFTLEILMTAQGDGWISPLAFPLCVPRKRLAFAGPDPTHANVLIYLGPPTQEARFCALFSELGDVRP